MKKMSRDQEVRFIEHLFGAFQDMDDPKAKKKAIEFQKLIFNYIKSKNPAAKLSESAPDINQTPELIKNLNQTLEQSGQSFLDIWEQSFHDLNQEEPILGSSHSNQMHEVKEKYNQLKEQFLLWDSYNNINNY